MNIKGMHIKCWTESGGPNHYESVAFCTPCGTGIPVNFPKNNKTVGEKHITTDEYPKGAYRVRVNGGYQVIFFPAEGGEIESPDNVTPTAVKQFAERFNNQASNYRGKCLETQIRNASVGA